MVDQLDEFYDYECEKGCVGLGFRNWEELYNHYHCHPLHNKCKYCYSASFDDQSQLQEHVRSSHVLNGKYSCEYCKQNFEFADDLARHLWFHPSGKPYYCHFCQRHFTTASTREQHYEDCLHKYLSQMAKSELICETCHEDCEGYDDYSFHHLTEHQQFTCRKCLVLTKFPSSKDLTDHIKEAHLQCKCCFYRIFQSNDELEDHIALDHNGPPFECTSCEKNFLALDALQVHVATHSQLFKKIYLCCRWCGIQFTEPHIFNQHQDFLMHKTNVSKAAEKNFPL